MQNLSLELISLSFIDPPPSSPSVRHVALSSKRFLKIFLRSPRSSHQNLWSGDHKGSLANPFHSCFTTVYPAVASDLFQIIIPSWHFSQKPPKAAHYVFYQICVNLAPASISVFRLLSVFSPWPRGTSLPVCEPSQGQWSHLGKPPDVWAALAQCCVPGDCS